MLDFVVSLGDNEDNYMKQLGLDVNERNKNTGLETKIKKTVLN